MHEISEFADFMRKSGKRRALAPIDPFLPETKLAHPQYLSVHIAKTPTPL
jgi:hypothetical protein